MSPDRVMTNAHVVAGANSVTVESSGNPYDATVVSYDPTADIAILVGAAPARRGHWRSPMQPATSGTEAIVMGYPGGGGFMATPARIREIIELNGPDIYRNATVTREVYTIRATVGQGNSGGPLIDLDGQVLGVVFGAAVDDNDTGFVLTANEVAAQLAQSATPRRCPPGRASAERDRYTRSRNRDQVTVDFVGLLFVAEMPCARRLIRNGRAARSAAFGPPGRPARTDRRPRACAASGYRTAGSSIA